MKETTYTITYTITVTYRKYKRTYTYETMSAAWRAEDYFRKEMRTPGSTIMHVGRIKTRKEG